MENKNFFWCFLLPKKIKEIIDSRENLHRILDSIGWLVVDKFLRMGLGLVLMAWIARYLGPKEYGLFTYALTFVGIFSIPASLGLYVIVVRELVRHPNREDEILGASFFLRIVGGVLAFIVSILAVRWLKAGDDEAILLVSIMATTILFQASTIIQWRFEVKLENKYIVWVQNTIFLLFAAIKILIIYENLSIIYFIYAVVAEGILFSLSLFIIYQWKVGKLFLWKTNSKKLKELIKVSLPILVADILIIIQSRFDQILIGGMADAKQLGYYGAALSIAEASSFSAAIIWTTLAPSISKAKTISSTLYKDRLVSFYRLNFLIFIIIAIFLVIFRNSIIELLYGSAYSPAAFMLALMSTRVFFAQMGMARGAFLVNENLLRYSLVTIAIGAIIGLILNFYWIPRYQALGAIYASIVSNFITLFFIDIFFKPARDNLLMMIYGIGSFHKLFKINNLK